jgi:predicted metal-dependent HD superfamily phosphohydrolase
MDYVAPTRQVARHTGPIMIEVRDPDDVTMTDAEREKLWNKFQAHPRQKCETPDCPTILSAYSRDDGLCSACALGALVNQDKSFEQETRRLATVDAAIQWKFDNLYDTKRWRANSRCRRYFDGYIKIMTAMTLLDDVFSMPQVVVYSQLPHKTVAMLMVIAERFGVVERLEERLYGRHIQWRRLDLE